MDFTAGSGDFVFFQQLSNKILNHIDGLTESLKPSTTEVESRQETVELVKNILRSELGIYVTPVGSVATHTFLSISDINITAFVNMEDDSSWFARVNEALCTAVLKLVCIKEDKESPIQGLSSFHIHSKMVNQAFINGFQVEISANSMISVYVDSLLEKVK